MRMARLGKRPSACHSVHIDQQGDSMGRDQAACEVQPHALPHPQSVFSPKSTSSRRGGREELGGEQVSSCFHCALSSGWTNFQNHVNARLFS